jgi:uncharacterized membrane protein YphA (DoxX/SURF4 family)
MKPYFSWLPGSLVAWAAIHDVVEFVGGILLAAGFLTRYAATALAGTMVSAPNLDSLARSVPHWLS